jgi:hypothetical protein
MKAGLATSVTMHAVLLGFGLVSLSAPRAFEVADVEALPVDIVPVSALSQLQEGDKTAPVAEKPAPQPTRRPDIVENATRIGEADTDMKTPPTPEVKPRPVEQASEPPPAPKPEPKPEVAEAPPEPTPPPPEPAPVAQPKPEPAPVAQPKPEPTPEPQVVERAEAENVALPTTAPVPQSRPQPPKPQEVAKAPEQPRREERPRTQEQPREQPRTEQKRETPKDDVLDQVAALLDKQKPSGGGAQRSTQEASLGASRTTGGEKLTQSEMDALRAQIQRCWNVPAGALDAQNLKVSLKFRLDPSGSVDGRPEVINGGGGDGVARAAAESARRAILQCAPYNLPADKYAAWADVIVHFDPSDMF